jgi:Protein of unknown function (DUF3489)
MNSTEITPTKTTVATVAAQGAPVAPKKAASTKAASPKKGSAKAKKGAKKAAIKRPGAKRAPKSPAEKVSAAGRAASKTALVLNMLRAKDGATLDQLMTATGWQRHTCRGFLSVAGKSMKIESTKTDAGRVYRITKQ